MRQLMRFAIDVRETDFVLRLEDETGETTAFAASVDQMDAVIDALNDLMADETPDADGDL